MNQETQSHVSDPLPPPANQRRWLALLLAVVIFVAGLASGAGLTVLYVVDRLQYAVHHPEEAAPRIAARIERRLNLDETQTAQVEQIITKRQREIAAIRRRFQPEIAEQLAAVRGEVAEVLSDPQRAEWTQLFDQFQQRWLPLAPPGDND